MIGTSVIIGCEHELRAPSLLNSTSRNSVKNLFFVASLLIICAARGVGQATPTVNPSDPVYELVDRLIAGGLVDTVIAGQRPLSRREIGRILAEAGRKMSTHAPDSEWLSRTLERYREVYPVGDSVSRKPSVSRYGAEVLSTDSPSRGIPPDANGAIDVNVNPLVANRLGVRQVDGTTGAVSTALEMPFQSWLVGSAAGRLTASRARGSGTSTDGQVDQLYARALFRNVAITVGRDYVFFGQGMSAGLTNSLNPRGFDMVRISSERPFVLPSLLRLFGPVSATAFLADLGASQRFPHTRLFNYKLSARPLSAVEIGATIADQVGGQGAPGGTFLQKAEDAFPLIDATILHRNLLFSNKFFGVDARLRVPNSRGLQLYMDGALDDFDLRRLRSSLTEDGGYVWGASLDCFGDCGPTKLTGEYHVTGLRYFTHGILKSGYTLDRQFIGDQLGPRAKGMYLTLDLDRIGHRFTIATAHEIRSGDMYGAVSTTTNDSNFHFVLLAHNPAERRWRSVVTTAIGHPTDAVTTLFSAGVERVEHFAFQPGSWRTNGLLQVSVEVRPGLQPKR
jgi:Capsule assembly protein Wzi